MDLAHSLERLRVLADASHAFAMVARDYASLLDRITRTVATVIGDGSLVTLLEPDGDTLVSAASAHRDPVLEAVYRTFTRTMKLSLKASSSVAATVVRTGVERTAHEVDPAAMVAASDPALKDLVAQLAPHSYAVVPIFAGGAVIGALSILRSRPGHGYIENDVTLLRDLADRAGLAIENARLYSELEARVASRTAELERTNAELHQSAARLALASVQKSNFLAGLSHELRTPLSAIIGFSELMVDGVVPRESAETTEFLGDILASATHLLHLVNSLLDLAKIEAGKLEFEPAEIRLSELITEVLAVLKPAIAKRRLRVEVAISDAIDQVSLDPARLRQVLYNYISNAIKFTPEGGRVTVRTASADGADGARVAIEVEDTGLGIALADAERLFVDFEQTRSGRAHGGTGLGLALTKRIVEAQGGTVGVASELGVGSVFRAELPRRSAS